MSTSPTAGLSQSPSRRDFFKRAGLGLGAVASVSFLQACDSNDFDDDADVMLDFSSDVDILNYAYALEQLEAAFYDTVVTDSAFSSTFTADQRGILNDLAAHEAIHRDFLAAAIQGAAGTSALIPNLTPDFSSVNFGSMMSVLGTAQALEDTGVGAYNGAGRYIQNDDYLLIAGKIVSVEARHASVISGLIQANTIAGNGVVDSNGLDQLLRPASVVGRNGAATPFITESISVVLPSMS